MRKNCFIALLGTLLLVSCNKSNEPSSSSSSSDDNETTSVISTDVLSGVSTSGDVTSFTIDINRAALDEDVSYCDSEDDDYIANTTIARTVYINYNTTGDATVSGDDAGLVTISGNRVTANNTTSDVILYVLSGTTSDGFFKLYSNKKQAIMLNGANITNPTGAAINNQSKKRTFVVLADGTDNTLTDGTSYTDTTEGEDMKACLFSEGQLIFSGRGSLDIDANCKAGIRSDDYVRFMPGVDIMVDASSGNAIRGNDAVLITGGVINVRVSGTADKGISTDGYVQVDGGRTTVITTGGYEYDEEDDDYSACAGIKADSLVRINAGEIYLSSTGTGGKGLNCDGKVYFNGGITRVITTGKRQKQGTYSVSPKGIKCDDDLTVTAGNIIVRATGGEGSEGIESKGEILISGGVVESYCYDDAINSAGNLTVSGGVVYARGTDNDGIDANKNLYFNGGVVLAEGGKQPECGIDAAEHYSAYINGGTIVAIGGGFQEIASSSKQAAVTAQVSTGTAVGLVSGSTAILHYTTPSNNTGNALMISSPVFKSGNTYTLRAGASYIGGTQFYNMVSGCSIGAGTRSVDVTASIGVSGSMGGGTGGAGGGFRF